MEHFLQDLMLINSIGLVKPELTLIITLVIAVFVDIIFKKNQLVTGYFTVAGFLVTAVVLALSVGADSTGFAFSKLLSIDPFSQFFKFITLIGACITAIMTFNSEELLKSKNNIGEYYILLIGMTIGMFLLSSASNLLMIYLAFETMSISSYVLAGYTKEIKRSSEASLKYVIYGSVASGVMIYGISLLFGLTGTLDLAEMNAALINYSGSVFPLAAAGLLILSGIAYKISAVPFHFWTPDVYEGAPVATTALLSVSSKAAGFAVLIRFFAAGFVDVENSTELAWNTITNINWSWIIAIISVLTMTLGNLLAVWQENVKRMLAYSSIAHAGYMLMGVMVMTSAGLSGVMFYFITYLLMNFGAFYVVQLVANKTNSENLSQYIGLSHKNPAVAAAMTIFMVSLSGVPPLIGFFGKWYLFNSVIEAGEIVIAVIGVLNSVVSLYYYMRVVGYMYLKKVEDTSKLEKISYGKPTIVFLFVLAIPVALFVINFSPLMEWVKNSAIMILR